MIKAKEPLLAVIFSLLLTGLGQIYAGKLKRGLTFFGVYLGVCLLAFGSLLYAFNPKTVIVTPLVVIFPRKSGHFEELVLA